VEAIKWYRLSAEQGYALAQFNIGAMYNNGEGVTQDPVQAHKWLNISGGSGLKEGHKHRDIIEKEMTSDQILEAQKLVREWMQLHDK
jgi:TPR repeat protein